MSNDGPLDARGVEIAAGDTVLYPYEYLGVGIAEGVVLGAHGDHKACLPPCQDEPSMTPSGRVRIRIVRRIAAHGGSDKATVDVAPRRLVVLKQGYDATIGKAAPHLPPSPLPTAAEVKRQQIENLIESCTADLRATEIPDRYYYEEWSLDAFHLHTMERLKALRRELRDLDD